MARHAWAGLLLGLAAMAAQAEAGLVVLVRHAEKAPGGGIDPALSEQGRARAAALAERMGGIPIKAIFVTEYRRTRQSAESLARKLGIAPRIVAAGDIEALVAAIRDLPRESAVLVIGHGNTVPQIVAALGGPLLRDFNESEYDRLLQLHLQDDAPARLEQSRY
ncbi:MAG TPA: histidine phosphatase family protein [Solimonas sp.]|nr:histidine phosphatase family protein [Solimonas sp.]